MGHIRVAIAMDEALNLEKVFRALERGDRKISVAGLNMAARAYFLARAFESLGKSMVVVAPNGDEAEKFVSDLRFFLEPEAPLSGWSQKVFLLPDYEVLPFQGISPAVEVTARRLGALYAMLAGTKPILVVASAAAAMQRVLPASHPA